MDNGRECGARQTAGVRNRRIVFGAGGRGIRLDAGRDFTDLFRFQVSIFLLIIVILSGVGSVWGVLIGGLLISTFDGVFVAQVMPVLFPNSDVQSLRWVFFGIGLIAFMIFRPQGLFVPRTVRLAAAKAPTSTTTATGKPAPPQGGNLSA